ncbi:MAG: copper chaperone PCu(A)C [Pseudomonadota bacterium]
MIPFHIPTLAAACAASFLMLSGQAPAHDYEIGSLEIDHPWSRATPAGAGVGAGYMVIRNTGSQADRLIAGDTTIAGRVEIHEMAVTDGVMTMRPIEGGLEIPAGGEVTLEPGGYHVMFMDLQEQIVEGEMFSAELVFETAGSIEVAFAVEGIGARAPADGHDHMDHGEHEEHGETAN